MRNQSLGDIFPAGVMYISGRREISEADENVEKLGGYGHKLGGWEKSWMTALLLCAALQIRGAFVGKISAS